MADKICSFKDYMKCKDDKKLSKTRKKMNRKRKDGSSKNVYGWAGYSPPPNLSGAGDGGMGGDGGGGMGEGVTVARVQNNSRGAMPPMGSGGNAREFENPQELPNVFKDSGSNSDAFKSSGQETDDIESTVGMLHQAILDLSSRIDDLEDSGEEDSDMEEPIDAPAGASDHEGDEGDPLEEPSDELGGEEESDMEEPLEEPSEYDLEGAEGGEGLDAIGSEEEMEPKEEEAEEPGSKRSQAKALYQNLRNQDMIRADIIDRFQSQLQLTPSSATAHYERIAKEFGDTEDQSGGDQSSQGAGGGDMSNVPGGGDGMGMMPGAGDGSEGMGDEEGPEEIEQRDWEDPNRQGVIRVVNNGHLVYKRQADDGKFEELWVLKQKDNFKDELNVRRDILAGTDIPVNKTKSDDGTQKSESWNVGNVQYIKITGLPN